MGKRESPTSGDQPSQGKCKRKWGTLNLSSADSVDPLADKDLRNISVESDTKKEKYVALSQSNNVREKDFETNIVLTEKSKQDAVPFNSTLSQKGKAALQMIEDHTEVSVAWKGITTEKENSAHETYPSQRMPGELAPCNAQESVVPVFSTSEMNKASKNLKETSFSMSIVTKEVDVSKIVGFGDEKRPDISFKEDSNSSLQNVQNNSSADVITSSNVVEIDSTMKNDSASSNNNFNPLISENVDSLTEDLDMASVKTSMLSEISSNSHCVKITCTKRNKRATSNAESASLGIFESTQTDASSPSSEVVENNNFVCSSASLDNAGSETVRKSKAEASVGDNMILLTKNESSSKSKGDDIVKMCNMLPNNDSKCNMFSEVNSVSELANDNDSVLKESSRRDAFADADKGDMFTEVNSEKSTSEVSSNVNLFSPEVASNSYQGEASRTSGEVFECGDAEGSDRAPASDVERRDRGVNVKKSIDADQVSDSVPREKNESLLDDLQKPTEGCPISAGKNPKVLPTDRKEGVSLPPSPIRGVIENSTSFDLPIMPNWLDSSHEEGSSFSFQIGGKVLVDGLHLNYSDITEAGSDNVKVYTCQNNASNSAHNHGETNNNQKEVASSSMCQVVKDVTSLGITKDRDEEPKAVAMPPEGTLVSSSEKKLLVLDLNGLLADVNADYRNARKAYKRVGGKAVFKRPFCDDFLKFCFEKFDIGVWSSRKKYNVDNVVDFLMGSLKHNLLFCWDESKCTYTGFKTIENKHKPLVLKDLRKLWDKEEHDLPWDKGRYSPSNTLLVDDSPYKALCNPPYTAIFPRPYHFEDADDNSLGPEGDLRVYLEGLAMADDVQHYVREHPFGQQAITDTDPSWDFYLQVIEKIEKSSVAAS